MAGEQAMTGRVPPTVPWGRAMLAALGSAAVLVLLFFYVPQWILTALPVASRALKAWLASGWMMVALAIATYVGWRLTGAARPSRVE